jgi:hypothetical protein
MATIQVAARPLSRPVLCARITTLRNALDLLCSQAAVDGHGSFACRGAMKVELIGLEAQLYELDGTLNEVAQRVNAQIQREA